MEPMDKDQVELEVRRVLASEETKYRDFLQSHFKQLTWAVGIIFTAAGIVFSFLFGNSMDKLEKRMDSLVDAKMLEYSIDKKVRNELISKIQDSVQQQATSPEIVKTIKELVTKVSEEIGSDFADDALRKTLKVEIEKLDLLNQETILSRVSIPKGSVLAFERQTCPEGWSEYVQAYGRFIRGIDKSGSSIDPAGARLVGSLQSDAIKVHHHHGGYPAHIISRYGIEDGLPSPSGTRYDFSDSQGPAGWTKAAKTNSVGEIENRPKNVALLYCKKE
ncbi:hypothetical protein [Psychromonas aquimarina]|uniref:hypothetical protein n=1 Tax=Psychromonas aquimarina TaxID=444919 RepID=UPI00041E4F69|nr:hypothetical protein [Psychromonas aquimarina]